MKVLVVQSCLALCDPMSCSLPGSSVHGILQVSYSLLQGIFPVQGLNLGLPYCRQVLYCLWAPHHGSTSFGGFSDALIKLAASAPPWISSFISLKLLKIFTVYIFFMMCSSVRVSYLTKFSPYSESQDTHYIVLYYYSIQYYNIRNNLVIRSKLKLTGK